MKRLFTLLLSLISFSSLIAQPCTNDLVLRGSTTNGFQQVLFSSTNPNGQADATQPEIASAAWTCNSLGVPECYTRSLFRFSLGMIPANAIINSAKLYLFAKTNNLNGNAGNPTFGTSNTSLLQKVVSDWQITSLSWNSQPASSSANQKTLAQSTSNAQNYVIDVADFVQSWVNKPDSNFGVMLRLQSEHYYNAMVFHSGQAIDSLKPRLVINYSIPNTIVANFIGKPGSQFQSLLLTSTNPAGQCDSTQSEIASAAWTCGSLNVPQCNARSVIKYDLSSIPQNATVSSATLQLSAKTNNQNGMAGNPTYGTANTSLLQKIITNWHALGTTWNSQPAAITQDQKILPQSTSPVQNYQVDVTSFTQDWVNKPDSNFGMLLRLQTEQYYNSMVFHSGQSAEAVQPRLQVCYQVNSVLPLTIKSFSAYTNSSINYITWSLYESNTTKTLTLERSTDGREFTTLTSYANTGSLTNSFMFEDDHSQGAKKFYYRLKFTAANGKISYSNVLVISTENKSGFRLDVFPNPAKNYLQLSITSDKDQPSTVVFSSIGGSVLRTESVVLKKGVNTITINDLSRLSKGTYLVTVNTESDKLAEKVMIN